MGYLRNRGTKNEPKWYVRYRDSDGKWKERPSHQPTKEAARRYVAEIEARVARGNIGIPEPTAEELARKSVRVRDLTMRFLGEVEGVAGYSSPRLKDLGVYRSQARTTFKVRILPTLGDRAAVSVTVADVKRLRDAQLAGGLKPGSVAQTLAYLSRLYTWARDAGLVDCPNPVAGCERTRSAEVLDFLDHAEVSRLLDHVESFPRVGVASWRSLGVAPMVATAVYCGLRKGELFGLRWTDVALDAARLDVNRSYDGLPKSGKPRHVPMHAELVRILRGWRERCPKTTEGLVFPVEAEPGRFRMGSKEDVCGLAEVLTLAECHIPTKPWHALRHTFASHFIMAGGNILTLQRLLGHADLKMTQRYAHLAPSFMVGEVSRMNFAPRPSADVADLDAERRRRAGKVHEAGLVAAVVQPGGRRADLGQARSTARGRRGARNEKAAISRGLPSVELKGIEPSASRVRLRDDGTDEKP